MKECYSDFVDEVMVCLEDSKCYLAIMPNDEGYDIEVEVNEGTIAGNYFTGTKNLNKARKIAEELEAELVRRGVNVFKTRQSWEDFLENENKKETDKPKWDLEEIPYETNDLAGGWYLHFEGEDDHESLYMSKGHVTEEQANLIAAAPELLVALQVLLNANEHYFRDFKHLHLDITNPIDAARAAIAKATGKS